MARSSLKTGPSTPTASPSSTRSSSSSDRRSNRRSSDGHPERTREGSGFHTWDLDASEYLSMTRIFHSEDDRHGQSTEDVEAQAGGVSVHPGNSGQGPARACVGGAPEH